MEKGLVVGPDGRVLQSWFWPVQGVSPYPDPSLLEDGDTVFMETGMTPEQWAYVMSSQSHVLRLVNGRLVNADTGAVVSSSLVEIVRRVNGVLVW